MGTQSVGNVSTSTRLSQAAVLFFGGTGYCHGVGNIPVEASSSTRVGTSFYFFSTSDLVYRSRHLLLAFPCLRLGLISYFMYSTITLIQSKKIQKTSQRQRIKHLPKPELP